MLKKREIEFDKSDEQQDGDAIFNEVFEMQYSDSKAKFEWNMYTYLTFLTLAIAMLINFLLPDYMYITLSIAAIIMVIFFYLNGKKRVELIKKKRIVKVRLKNHERNVQGYTTIKAKNAYTIMQEKCTIIEVSVPEYYNEMHIENAISIPLEILEEEINKLNLNDDETILVYSRGEDRCKLGAQKLVDLGFKDVYCFGSIMDWPFDVIINDEQTDF